MRHEDDTEGFLQSVAAGAASSVVASDSILAGATANQKSGDMGSAQRVIIDSDTATDDALAILLALNAPNLRSKRSPSR